MMPRDPAVKRARGTGADEPVMQTVNILDNFEYLTRYGFPQHIWTHTCFFVEDLNLQVALANVHLPILATGDFTDKAVGANLTFCFQRRFRRTCRNETRLQ